MDRRAVEDRTRRTRRPARLTHAVGDADRDREGVRGVVRRRQGAHPEHDLDHPLDLLLVGCAIPGDRALDLVRGGFPDRQAGLRSGEEHDPPGVADRDRRLGIPREEDPLDGDHGGFVQRDEFRHVAMNCEQPLAEWKIRRGHEAAMVDGMEPARGLLDESPAEGRGPGVDAQDDHQ